MSELEEDVAGYVAEMLIEAIDAGHHIEVAGARVTDAAYEEGERELDLLLSDGRTVELRVRETGPRPAGMLPQDRSGAENVVSYEGQDS